VQHGAIDVHSHIYPPTFVHYLEERREPPFVREVDGVRRFMLFPGDRGVPLTDDFTSPDAKVAFMDRHGIGHSVVSLGNPWLDLDPGPASIPVARRCSEEIVALTAEHPERLSAMGVLPNAEVKDAVRRVEDLAAGGQVVGLVTGTTVCGHTLAAPDLDPLWDAVDASGLPVLVHPQAGLGAEATRGFGQAMTLALAFPFETTVALARLVLSGALHRRPNLRDVAAHGGGTLPYLLGRLGRAVEVDPAGPTALTVPAGLYVDSILFSRPALAFATEVMGSERVVFGTDHPFPIADAAGGLADLAALAEPGSALHERVSHRNAAELFGLPGA
jgi:predicted TIM-barrel fold metal-dependent hydrolase